MNKQQFISEIQRAASIIASAMYDAFACRDLRQMQLPFPKEEEAPKPEAKPVEKADEKPEAPADFKKRYSPRADVVRVADLAVRLKVPNADVRSLLRDMNITIHKDPKRGRIISASSAILAEKYFRQIQGGQTK